MDELIGEFLSETFESLDVIDSELVKFEADPTDRATLDNIFRLLHTIKGTCGFLGLERLEAIAHAGETLLGKFRDGDLVADSSAVTLVLQSLDRIKEILTAIEQTGAEPAGEDGDLITRLEIMSEGGADPEAAAPPPAPEPEIEPEPAPVMEASTPEADEPVAGFDADLGRELRPGEVSLADLEAAFMNTPGPEEEETPEAAAIEADDELDEIETAPPPAAPAAAETAGQPAQSGGAPRASATIRVSVDVLENLMTTVSELVLARNQMHQIVRGVEDSALKTPLQRLSSVTAELQDGVMKTRMQPVGDAWKKLPRIVRDAQQDLGKKIKLIQEGEDTELDRQVLELIKDPLTHMIRNSCDHGLETPEKRAAAGKSETGTIKLAAYHEGGAIIIKIIDDGAGIDPDRQATIFERFEREFRIFERSRRRRGQAAARGQRAGQPRVGAGIGSGRWRDPVRGPGLDRHMGGAAGTAGGAAAAGGGSGRRCLPGAAHRIDASQRPPGTTILEYRSYLARSPDWFRQALTYAHARSHS